MHFRRSEPPAPVSRLCNVYTQCDQPVALNGRFTVLEVHDKRIDPKHGSTSKLSLTARTCHADRQFDLNGQYGN